MKLNPEGIEPFEYLNFAKSDISTNDIRGAINGLGNAKKAIHLTIECLFEILGLAKGFEGARFPVKLEIIKSMDSFPTSIIENLNKKRNFVEHEYKKVDPKEVVNFIDITEMFIRLCYPFLKHMVIGVRVGIKEDERDLFWMLNPHKSLITIYEKLKSKSLNSPIGRIYYDDVDSDETSTRHLKTINIMKSNIDEWMPYLNTFIYCTKREIIPKNPPYDPKIFKRLMMFQIYKGYPKS
ncbi:MAG: hypothetical protein ACYCXK_10145 [Candidatus Humimicrobiaceae bacterium]